VGGNRTASGSFVMVKVKLVRMGDDLVFVIPTETAERHSLEPGQEFVMREDSEAFVFDRRDDAAPSKATNDAIAHGRDLMDRYDETFRVLAK
jgi:hypothetical protein